jgi:hypothetical protein
VEADLLRRFVLRAVAGAVLAGVLSLSAESLLVDAFVLNGWRWCDNWANIKPGVTYSLEQYPVQNAAAYWSWVSDGGGRKVNFDYYWTTGSAKINLESDSQNGQNGEVGKAMWGGWPWCFGSGTVLFNTAYSFYPPSTVCQPPTGYYHLESVALHELGHLVGLDHSGTSAAIMWRTIPACTYKGMDSDDRQGILQIYGVR